MQDYSYLNTSTFQLDGFVDCCGSPDKSRLPLIWNEHKESLLAMMDAVTKGITGTLHTFFRKVPNKVSWICFGLNACP
jgi:hypothetical protein